MSPLVWLAVIIFVAGLIAMLLDRLKWRPKRGLDDTMIRQIEEDGWVEIDDDEPLDWDEIAKEEERFWTEKPWEQEED